MTIATAVSRKAYGDRRLARVERELLAETNKINTTSGLLVFCWLPHCTYYFPNELVVGTNLESKPTPDDIE